MVLLGKWMGLYPGELKTGGVELKWDFTVYELGHRRGHGFKSQ